MKFLKNVLQILGCFAIVGVVCYLVYAFVIPEEWINKIKEKMGAYEDSGITGEDCEIDEEFYPYYGYLSEDCQKLYKQIYANALALETAFVPVVGVSTNEVANVVNAVYHDHPELFWLDSGYEYKYVEDNICVHIVLKFNETADGIEESKKLFEEASQEIIVGASVLGNDYEKEKYVYDELLKRVDYDETAKLHQSPYSALVYGKTVCAGYARAFQYIMIELGVPTYYCTGEVEGHAWNIVKLDGGYYNVDLSRDCFNKTDEDVKGSHKRSGYSALLPKCRSKKYK